MRVKGTGRVRFGERDDGFVVLDDVRQRKENNSVSTVFADGVRILPAGIVQIELRLRVRLVGRQRSIVWDNVGSN